MWTCPKCDSKVDPSFEVCWNCGTAADGTEDPTFVRADDAAVIEEPSVVPNLDADLDASTMAELPEPLQGELVEAYRAFDLIEARFLADQLTEAGIPAAADTHDFAHQGISSVTNGPRVWVREDELPRARTWLEGYERQKTEHADR